MRCMAGGGGPLVLGEDVRVRIVLAEALRSSVRSSVLKRDVFHRLEGRASEGGDFPVGSFITCKETPMTYKSKFVRSSA